MFLAYHDTMGQLRDEVFLAVIEATLHDDLELEVPSPGLKHRRGYVRIPWCGVINRPGRVVVRIHLCVSVAR